MKKLEDNIYIAFSLFPTSFLFYRLLPVIGMYTLLAKVVYKHIISRLHRGLLLKVPKRLILQYVVSVWYK